MPRTPVAPGAVGTAYLAYTAPSRRNGRGRVNKAVPSVRKPSVNLSFPESDDHLETRSRCMLDTTPSSEGCLSLSAISKKADLPHDLQPTAILCLPAEIRLMIFREVLRVEEVGYEQIVLDLPSFKLVYPGFINLSRGSPKAQPNSVLCILQVCRQFYSEAAPIFYEVNQLRLSTPVMLFYFLRDLPRTRRHMLRHLRIGGVGFDRTGWQLTRRAFSMLALCPRLQTVEIDLIWGSVMDLDAWAAVAYGKGLTEHPDLAIAGFGNTQERSLTLAIEELHLSTVCLMALRKLRSIKFNMICEDKTLLEIPKDAWPKLQAEMAEMKKLMEIWITRIKVAIT